MIDYAFPGVQMLYAKRMAYRTAAAIAVVGVFLLIWLSLGVGVIGQDGDPANRMYFAVAAVGIIGAAIARCRAGGLARTLITMALIQALITLIALLFGLGLPWSGPGELLALNGFFIALFCASAWLFRRTSAAESH